MANHCYTNFYVQSPDREALKGLAENIERWASLPDYPGQGCTTRWLGNIVGYSGIGDPRDGKIRCEGYLVNDIRLKEDTLAFETETNWTPRVKMWRLLCDKYLKDYSLTFTAEEDGCELYWTNDPDIEGSYILDLYDVYDLTLEGFNSDWECPEKRSGKVPAKGLGHGGNRCKNPVG